MSDSARYRCGEVTVDAANRQFLRGGTEIALEPKVMAVILQLLAKPHQLVTREELLDAVWGHRYVSASTLNRTIMLARKAFAPHAENAPCIQTVHGAGYRYVGPIDGTESAEPRAHFQPPLSARVPARLDAIIGREEEIRQIGAMLGAHRAVTVVGAGGMGKTQCALEYARREAQSYPDGVWFFDLAPLAEGREWLMALASALTISARHGADLMLKVAGLLSARRALLVLDNCDRIAASVGTLAVELLRLTEGVQILSTSQQLLNFVGERALRIPPLKVPAPADEAGAGDLAAIAASPAVQLLLMRIRDNHSGFALSAQNAAQLSSICRMLDGMPLALELAASRFALLSPQQVLERLSQRFQFLVDEVAGRDVRHQTLQALIEWSFSLLSADERRLLSWLGTFVQGWTAELLAGIAPAMNLDAERALDLLAGLVGKSLVTADRTLLEPRYRLLESVRSFALEELARRGEERAAMQAFLASIRVFAQRVHADMQSGMTRERIGQISLEHANISAAIEWAVGHGERDAALDIVGSLMLYSKSRGAYTIANAWATAALDGLGNELSPMFGRALLARGVVELHIRSTIKDSANFLVRACKTMRVNDDAWGLACASGYRALELADAGRQKEARKPAHVAQSLAGELHDEWLAGLAGLAQGWIRFADGDLPGAIEVLRSVRSLGKDVHQQHFIEMYLGLAHFGLGQAQPAAVYWRDGMRNALQVLNVRGAAGSVEGCAYLAAGGRPAQALRWLSLAEAIRNRTKIPLFGFWVPFREQALAKIRDALEAREFEAIVAASESKRQEDSLNEAFADLIGYAEQTSG